MNGLCSICGHHQLVSFKTLVTILITLDVVCVWGSSQLYEYGPVWKPSLSQACSSTLQRDNSNSLNQQELYHTILTNWSCLRDMTHYSLLKVTGCCGLQKIVTMSSPPPMNSKRAASLTNFLRDKNALEWLLWWLLCVLCVSRTGLIRDLLLRSWSSRA